MPPLTEIPVQRPQYTELSPGRLVPVAEGRVAFVPDPLPSELQLDRTATDALANAEYALGRLAGATATFDERLPVLAPLQYREALLSSRIDRIATTPERLVLMAAGVPDGSADEQASTRSVLRYVRTIDYGLASKLPVSVRLISELRAVLITDETDRNRTADEMRQVAEPAAGSADQPRVVRLPVREMQNCLDTFEARLQAMPPSMPALVELALLHYQFEAIHPFRQGNGRVGRLILPLMLFRQNRLPQPLLYLSAYLERHRDEYFESLRAVSRRSAWLPWVTFFLRGVEESATKCLEDAESLFELHDRYHALFQGSDSYDALRPLIDGLFVLPCTSVERAASSCELTDDAAAAAIDELVARGILFGVDGPAHERLFLAPAILGFMRTRDETASS
jgi:Fic family protein